MKALNYRSNLSASERKKEQKQLCVPLSNYGAPGKKFSGSGLVRQALPVGWSRES
jgi:hypothetical protein